MIAKDDEHKLHMHECTTYGNVRREVAIVAMISVVALIWATIKNVQGDDRRLRYPGRLVTCFGISIMIFHILVALGWVIDFKHLDWGENSNYHYYHDNDEDGDKLWHDLCTGQGFLIQVALISMAFYSAWISYAFFYVIDMRMHGNYLLRQFNEQNNFRFEMRMHIGIFLFGVGAALTAALTNNIGSDSGITACWVDGYQYQQIYYYYIWMVITVFGGIFFSIVATIRLHNVLTSTESMWLAEHRSLRRVVYGNIMWTMFVAIIAIIPIIDIIEDTKTTCVVNNIAINCSGVVFYLTYNVFPHYLERCFEDKRLRSLAHENSSFVNHMIGESLLSEDYTTYARRTSSSPIIVVDEPQLVSNNNNNTSDDYGEEEEDNDDNRYMRYHKMSSSTSIARASGVGTLTNEVSLDSVK
jgi:hypothetical protein